MLTTSTTSATGTAGQTVPTPPRERIGRPFYLIWGGQTVSMFGTMLTGFALGVWLFQRTGSVLDFAGLALFSTLPGLLLMPWSGSVADRFNRRTILIAGELVAPGCATLMGLMFWRDSFAVWQLYALQTVLSLSVAIQGPTAFATISSIVPKSQFGRAGGLFQISGAVSQICGPLVAATLLGKIGMLGIIAFDMATFSASLLGLFLAVIPPAQRAPGEGARRAFKDLAWSIDFLVARPSLTLLYGYTCLGGFLSGMVIVLVTPMVLSTYDAHALATISSSGAAGVLASGVLMMVWGGQKKFSPRVLGFSLLQGLMIATAGWYTSVPMLCLGAFVVMFCSGALSANMQTVWRRKLPRERQGSFAALQQAVQMSLMPASAAIGGGLAHYLFEPALMPDGIWFAALGPYLGTGAGRGTALLFVVAGLLAAAVAALAMTTRRLRDIDTDVPDAF